MEKITFVHTNILAENWIELSQFYIDAFDCKPVFPERDLKGKWIEKMTNIKGVHIQGIHLQLPGFDDGPTLEIFSYNESNRSKIPPLINNTGYSHISFRVEDLKKCVDNVLKFGGSFYGEIINTKIKDVGELTAVYMRDPEKNIIEIQSWN